MTDKEKHIFNQIQYLLLEKAYWTVEELAERANCTVDEARKMVEELNI